MDLKNKVIIVTGSSQGIGKETGIQLMSLGAKVVFVARNKDKLKNLQNQFGTKRALFLPLDLTIEKNCKKLVDLTKKKFGKIDILINNVGKGFRGKFEDTDIVAFKSLIEINLMSAVYCTKYALKYLIKSKGSIIFISSISGIRGLPCYGGYSVSKKAINGFAELLDIELSKKGVHVGTLLFGPVEVERGKTVIDSRGHRHALSKPSKMISLNRAAKKIIKSIKRRKPLMVITPLAKTMFFMNRIFPGLLRFLLKKFKCPEDFH